MTPFPPLTAWLVHPWLFAAGTAAALLPILIHLLNRRRFVVVEWAAMDFLLEAQKQNRRRIRLEDFVLLLLRCLAVLLIGLLIARPFVPTNVTAGLLGATRFEHIVLLDDSLSMQARVAHQTSWDIARQRLRELAAEIARRPGENSLTLLAATHPERPLLKDAPLNVASLDQMEAAIDRLSPGDGASRYDIALEQLDAYVTSQDVAIHRVLYILTDLRQRDWLAALETTTQSAQPVTPGATTLNALADLSKRFSACYLMDVGSNDDRNLAISALQPEGPLAVGVPAALDVAVTNFGSSAFGPANLELSTGAALPLHVPVQPLATGETSRVQLQLMLPDDLPVDSAAKNPPPRPVTIELKPAEQSAGDLLAADNLAYFAARPTHGTRVLIVDGDPGPTASRAESYFLRRSLAPPGPVPSGIVPEVVPEDELESLPLDDYAVVCLLNNFKLGNKPEETAARLEQWARDGGGVVIFPGDQVDPALFNRHLWRGGAGLAPLPLAAIHGDASRESWVGLQVADLNHAVFGLFAGENNPLLESVKIFRWWGTMDAPQQSSSGVAVAVRFSDADRSPAVAEQALGRGRVVQFMVPADADWHTWPSEPSFLLVMQDLVRALSKDRGDAGQLRVGQPIRHWLDITRYEPSCVLFGPGEFKMELQATAPSAATGGGKPTLWTVEYPEAAAAGFYELHLTRRDGGRETVLFAANVDPAEGDLKRVDSTRLHEELDGTNIRLLRASQTPLLVNAAGNAEIWRYLVWAVFGVLAAEQLLGWLFGRWRT